MHNFEKRRDRYELFAAFEKPLVNVSFEMVVPNFRPYCKEHKLRVDVTQYLKDTPEEEGRE